MGTYRIVIDSGALSAFADGNEKVRSYLRKAVENGAEIVIPTVVIAESTTGTARDAPVNRVMRALTPFVVSLDEPIARAAGALRYRAGRPARDTIDAIVVANADAVAGSNILTGDASDVGVLAGVRGRSRVVAV